MSVDADYTEVTYQMESDRRGHIRELPTRYGMQIKRWECNHCDFNLSPDRSKGNFGRVSHGRSQMRKHVAESHKETK